MWSQQQQQPPRQAWPPPPPQAPPVDNHNNGRDRGRTHQAGPPMMNSRFGTAPPRPGPPPPPAYPVDPAVGPPPSQPPRASPFAPPMQPSASQGSYYEQQHGSGSHDDEDNYYEHDEDDGALGAAITMVTGAASMFFKSSSSVNGQQRQQQKPPPPVFPPPSQTELRVSQPPAPIDPQSSMLDDPHEASPTATQNIRTAPVENSVPNNGPPSARADGGYDGRPLTLAASMPSPSPPSPARQSTPPAQFYPPPPQAQSQPPSPAAAVFEAPPPNPSPLQLKETIGGPPPFLPPTAATVVAAAAATTSAPPVQSVPSFPPPRSTPPASPSVGRTAPPVIAPSFSIPAIPSTKPPPSPSTPLMTNQTTTTTAAVPTAGDAALAISMPPSSAPLGEATQASRSVKPDPGATPVAPVTPVVRRRLRAPPKSVLPSPAATLTAPSASSGNKSVSRTGATPSRSKFRLPTPRKKTIGAVSTRSPANNTAPAPATALGARQPQVETSIQIQATKEVDTALQPNPTAEERPAEHEAVPIVATVPPSVETPVAAATLTQQAAFPLDNPPVDDPDTVEPEQNSVDEDVFASAISSTEVVENPEETVPTAEMKESVEPEEPVEVATQAVTPPPIRDNVLPSGWTELTDPNSGQIYYYNELTGVSSWERPAFAEETDGLQKEMAVKSLEDQGVIDEMAKEADAAAIDMTLDALNAEFGIEEQGASLAMGTSTEDGGVLEDDLGMDLKAQTKATIEFDMADEQFLDQPTGPDASPAEETASPDTVETAIGLASEHHETDAIPVCWREMIAPNGQVYYFNELSGESTWERPSNSLEIEHTDADQANCNENNLEEILTNDEPMETLATEEEPACIPEETDAELPEGWVEAVDPSSRHTFFYHPASGESRWERPFVESVDLMNSRENDTEKDVDGEKEQTALDDHGQPETTAPNEARDDLAPFLAEDAPLPTVGYEPETENEEEEVHNAFSAVHVTASDPTDDAAEEFRAEIEGNAAHELSNALEDIDDGGAGLPPDWIAVDDSDGMYYYNTITGESQWELPVAAAMDEMAAESPVDVPPSSCDEDLPIPTSHDVVEDAISEQIIDHHISASLEEDHSQPEQTIVKDIGALLPSGWTEAVDPGTNQPFYWNESTGESSWKWPTLNSSAEIVPTTGGGKLADDFEPSSELFPSEPIESGSPSFTECKDVGMPAEHSSGNAIRMSESLEDPHSSVPSEGTIFENEIDAKEPEGTTSLPEGWEASFDPNTNRIFYFHGATGESSWERPIQEDEAVAHDSLQQEEKAEGPIENPEDNNPVPSDLLNEQEMEPYKIDPAMAGGNWVECMDDTTGEKYYYNFRTGDVTYDKPCDVSEPTLHAQESEAINAPEREGLAGELAAGGDALVEMISGESLEDAALGDDVFDGDESGPLPSGWEEAVDESSGRPFYYNEATGETSWERPASEMSDNVEDNGEREFDAPPPPGQAAMTESLIGKVGGEVLSTSVDASEDGPENSIDVTASASNGWEVAKDPATGGNYYVNQATGEASWEAPDEPTVGHSAGDESMAAEEDFPKSPLEEAYESVQVEDEMNEVDQNEEAQDASAWIEAEDPTTSKAYWYNTSTGETSWKNPFATSAGYSSLRVEKDGIVDKVPEQTEDADPFPLAADALLEGWVEAVDANGEPYWYNPDTQDATRERPIKSVGGAILAAKGDTPTDLEYDDGLQDEDDGGIQDDWVDVPNPAPVLEDAEDNGAYLPQELPEGWMEVNNGGGEVYYWNEITDETSWEIPTSKLEVEPIGDKREVDDADTEDADEQFDTGIDHTMKAPLHEMEVLPEENGDALQLPEFWVEGIDEASGRTYYYHTLTQETRWEPPTSDAAEMQSSSAVESDHADHGAAQQEHKTGLGRAAVSSPTTTAPYLIITAVQDERARLGINGPFTTCDDSVVAEYIRCKASAGDLLWQLIAIAVTSRGRLRSQNGVKDESSPETAIVELLLRETDQHSNGKTGKTREAIVREDKGEVKSLDRVENLVVRGQREAAIETAILMGDFATAFLVASYDRSAFQLVAQRYSESTFLSGSPMHTAGLLLSGSFRPASTVGSGNWGIPSKELAKTWKSHLAAIISNRTAVAGSDHMVLSLGDRLHQNGDVMEAHFCYMVGGSPITSPVDSTTRMALLGCDHDLPANLALQTEDSLCSYERTEAFEWAKRQGNKNAKIGSFQPFKLVYAMHLADIGHYEPALSLLESIPCQSHPLTEMKSLVLHDIFDAGPALSAAIEQVRSQLTSNDTPSPKYGDSFLLGEELNISVPLAPVSASMPTPIEPDRMPMGSRWSSATPFMPGTPMQQPTLDPNNKQSLQTPSNMLDPDTTFASAKSNLMDVTGYSLDGSGNPIRGDVNPPRPETTMLNLSLYHAPTNARSPFPAAAPKMNGDFKAETIPPPDNAEPTIIAPALKERKRPKSPPATAPPVLTGMKSEKEAPKTPAPSSSGGRKNASNTPLSGLKSWFIKKFNPDATECQLPENEEKAYYDKERKRWIFPGEDPDEVAKPLAPPPITPGPEITTTATPANDAPLDPLAAMMAPPSRGALARKPPVMSGTRGGFPAVGQLPPGIMPPGGRSMAASSPGGARDRSAMAPPPQFAVFTPKPVPSNQEE